MLRTQSHLLLLKLPQLGEKPVLVVCKGIRFRPPEFGLVPPGVIADWNAFAYHFSLSGYYCAGLREAGRALAEAGLACDPALILHGRLRQEGGYQMAQQAMALASRPTALFAANNFIAIGAYRALSVAGLRVPDDIAMVAFDDLPAALILEPFLTVAAQPAYEMGQIATELLLARLSGKAPGGCQEIVLPVEIIIRRSSGNPLTRK